MLDVYELNIFLVAAETENFSAAARQLNLTQPAVSMQMRGLEKKLGVSLFHRTGRSLALTEQGKTLIPMARDIINRAIQIEEEIESLKGEVVGHLKIGCSTTIGKYILPQLVAQFRQRHPRVQISIYNNGRDMVVNELIEGLVQLAVVSFKPFHKDVEYRHFFTDQIILIVPPEHPWAEEGIITPDALKGVDFILRDNQSGTRQAIEDIFHEVGLSIDDLNPVMEIGNSEAISMAVEQGIGVSFVSQVVAQRAIELGKVKEIQVEGLSISRKILVASHHRHPATRAQSEFWNFILQLRNGNLKELVS